METFILANEPVIRLVAFIGIFVAVAVAEWVIPRRPLTVSKGVRWLNNIAIVVLNTVVVRLIFVIAAVGMARVAEEQGWGVLHWLGWPAWIAIPLAVLALDMVIYLQHVMFHAVPALWRLHMMHHADQDIDLTTGARFHPIEIVLSMLVKIAAVMVIGAPAVAVVIFEVVLNATAMFNHGNVRIPVNVDRILRLFLVTPDMHRVHHSVVVAETNSNFGFNFPWWDRLFGTYRAQPAAGHLGMTIGLKEIREPRLQWLWHMLAMPFVNPPMAAAIVERDNAEAAGPERPSAP